MESGGYSMLRGARYQNLWAARQLLLLLTGELASVRIEPAGEEGEGIDIVVALPDGSVEYQQCKRSNRQVGKWSLAELAERGVLSTLSTRLRADATAIFRLVSADGAPELQGLAEAARDSRSPESFFADQLQASGPRSAHFRRFCAAVGLDHGSPEEIQIAHDLLRRCEVTTAGDDKAVLRDLRSRAGTLVAGNAGAALAALESLALERLRCQITLADVGRRLRSLGFHLQRLADHPALLPAIEALQRRFDASLTPQLIGGRLLPRKEATALLELLTDPEGPRFIALHGPAGVGKSGVLLEMVRQLEGHGVSFLPLRLDRQRPTGTPRHLGRSLDLPNSPVLCLGALAGDRLGVLVLDQLDALRWSSGDAAYGLDVCRELVWEATSFPNVRVVASCRTFDLEHDPQIRGWVERKKARKVPVQRLSRPTVEEALAAMGIDPGALGSRQIDLLRNPQVLRTWEETSRVTGETVVFATERELLDAFWKSRLAEAQRRMNVSAAALQGAVESIVEAMEERGALVAPARLLHGEPLVGEALQSLNVITVEGGKIAFCHQTYFDHHLTHRILRRLDKDEISVEEWFASGHQGLYRREQLRLVFEILREEDFERYLSAVRALLDSGALRFHLKQLVLEVLGRVEEPHPREIEVVLRLVHESQWREHAMADVLLGNRGWFAVIDEEGLFETWLDDEHEENHAMRLIASVVDEEGERCSGLLAPLLERGGEWPLQVAHVLPLSPGKDSPSVFDLRVRLAEMGRRRIYTEWESLGGPNLEPLTRLLSATLTHLDPDERERPMQGSSDLHGLAKVPLGAAPFEQISRAWTALLPRAAKLIGRAADEETPEFGEERGWRADLRAFMRSLATELVTRDAAAAIGLVEEEPARLGELLLVEALPGVTTSEQADRALQWLMARPHRLRLRWRGSDSPWKASAQATERLTRLCSAEACASFERFVVDFREPDFLERMRVRHRRLVSPQEGDPRFSHVVLRRPSTAGATAYHLLPRFPPDRLSESARRHLAAQKRKFATVGPVFFAGWGEGRGGWVRSPLLEERLNTLSDKTWLGIIHRNNAPKGSKWRAGEYRDGFMEKSTPETFARDLESATLREPGRFARLALDFPPDGDSSYLRAVIQGLGGQPGSEPPGDEATLEELEAVLALPQVAPESSLAIPVVRLVERRAELGWGSDVLALVAQIATHHADPAAGTLSAQLSDSEEWGPENLTANAMNCTRGFAVYAMASLLFAETTRLETFGPSLDRIVDDPHPAVRLAAFKCCLAVLVHQPKRAIEWALRAAQGHEALLATSDFDHFLLYAARRHPTQMEGTLLRMLDSERADVVRVGARHVVGLYLIHDHMEVVALSCIDGSTPQRAGAAEVAAALAAHPECGERARQLLLQLVDDIEESVLVSCAEAFRGASLDDFEATPEFMEAYASSRAFQRFPSALLHRLKDHAGALVPFASCILHVSQSLVAAATGETGFEPPAFSEGGYYLPGILLRLYEQAAEHPEIRELCLDAWDVLLQARVVAAVSLTKELGEEG